jgi:uncharacterized protein YfaP (DUF2135 family)
VTWFATCDIDLYVTEPSGEVIFHGNTTSATGGQLDHDANYPCSGATNPASEMVSWPPGGAPPGTYSIQLQYFGECSGEGTVNWHMVAIADGTTVIDQTGTADPGQVIDVGSFMRP